MFSQANTFPVEKKQLFYFEGNFRRQEPFKARRAALITNPEIFQENEAAFDVKKKKNERKRISSHLKDICPTKPILNSFAKRNAKHMFSYLDCRSYFKADEPNLSKVLPVADPGEGPGGPRPPSYFYEGGTGSSLAKKSPRFSMQQWFFILILIFRPH